MQRLWFSSALLEGGWASDVRIVVDGGRIVEVAPNVRPTDEERCGVAIPGLPNVHSHAFQRAMAGLTEWRSAEGDDFWSWRELMYRFVDRLTPDDVQAIAAQAYVEMLESGFTHVGEFHYLHHDCDGRKYANIAETAERIVAAAQEAGIGLTLLPTFYAHSDFGGLPPTHGQRRFVCSIDEFSRLLDASRRAASRYSGANVGVAPHSLRAVTPEELAEVVAMAPEGPIHIHASEQTREVDRCVEWSGLRPVDWLLRHQAVDERWCIIHATHANQEELAALARTGAVVGFCPITEANLGDGICDVRHYTDCGGRIAVGTDSNVLIDAAGELRQLEYSQRLARRQRNVLAATASPSVGRSLLASCLEGGGRALGLLPPGLAIGKPADLVSLDLAGVRPGSDTSLDAWIFGPKTNVVDSVWRGGVQVVSEGRHVLRDRIEDRFHTTTSRLADE